MQTIRTREMNSILLPRKTVTELFADRQAEVKWRLDSDGVDKRNSCYLSNGCQDFTSECGNLIFFLVVGGGVISVRTFLPPLAVVSVSG